MIAERTPEGQRPDESYEDYHRRYWDTRCAEYADAIARATAEVERARTQTDPDQWRTLEGLVSQIRQAEQAENDLRSQCKPLADLLRAERGLTPAIRNHLARRKENGGQA